MKWPKNQALFVGVRQFPLRAFQDRGSYNCKVVASFWSRAVKGRSAGGVDGGGAIALKL